MGVVALLLVGLVGFFLWVNISRIQRKNYDKDGLIKAPKKIEGSYLFDKDEGRELFRVTGHKFLEGKKMLLRIDDGHHTPIKKEYRPFEWELKNLPQVLSNIEAPIFVKKAPDSEKIKELKQEIQDLAIENQELKNELYKIKDNLTERVADYQKLINSVNKKDTPK